MGRTALTQSRPRALVTAVQAVVSPGWGDETAHEQKPGCSAAAGPVAASHQPVSAAFSQAPDCFRPCYKICLHKNEVFAQVAVPGLFRFAPSPPVMEVTPLLLCQLLSTQLHLTGVSLTSFPFIQVWFQRPH